jgi:RNA polymerase sigma-70 factor (ECF subfamily)
MMQRDVSPETTIRTEARRRNGDGSVDGADFAELVRAHWAHVFRICLGITRNKHDAEDAAQDCFLNAFSHFHQFQGRAQISTWLHSIARNSSLMLLRKRRRRQEIEFENSPDPHRDLPLLDPIDGRPDQLTRLLYEESSMLLVKSIDALPINLRATAELVILNERTLHEVGQIFDISQANVKSRLFRARSRLGRLNKRRFKASIAQHDSAAERPRQML